MFTERLINEINQGFFDDNLLQIYVAKELPQMKDRIINAIYKYTELYGDADVSVFSVGGRSEIMGNHTDHNYGKAIAASISYDIIAVASKTDSDIANVKSEFHELNSINIDDLAQNPDMYYGSNELLRGVYAGFKKNGRNIGGINAYTTSNVKSGSGLSSSAAYEVMLGNILNHFYNDGKISNIEIAKIAQYAENDFYGKPCGLLDQLACAYGGLIYIDFASPKDPLIKPLNIGALQTDYSVCIVYPGDSHSDLNDDYADIPKEMKEIASFFGKNVLRDVCYNDIVENISTLRKMFGDRAVLRAIHFFNENKRVEESSNAIENGNITEFLNNIDASGDSSFKNLQNLYSAANPKSEGLPLALSLSFDYLKGKDSHMRVHGGGFAGTVLVVVKNEYLDGYVSFIESCFGNGSCAQLTIRSKGAIKLI